MRFAALLLAVSPSFAFADTIIARSVPTQVTVYTQGAVVKRTADIQLPAGRHTLVLPDMTMGMSDQVFDIDIPGAAILATEWRNDDLGPFTPQQTPELIAAKGALEQAEDALQSHMDLIDATKLAASAANAQIAFLNDLAKSKTLPDGIDTLRDLSRMIAEETLAANTIIQNSTIEARTLAKDTSDLKDDVERAQIALDELLPYDDNIVELSITIDVPTATDSTLTLTHYAEALWAPTYDLHLDTSGATPRLAIERGAIVRQSSGVHWKGVDLTLSSLSLGSNPGPWEPRPKRLRISEPETKQRVSSLADSGNYGSPADPVLEAPVIIEEASSAGVYIPGIAATYSFDHKVNVNARADEVQLSLGTLAFDVEMSARAVALHEQTAYRIINLTNDSAERILPADRVRLHVDGNMIADSVLEEIPAGAEAEIEFGAIHGIRLTRTILGRNEGDRGIITRSNEKTEDVRIDVENLTGDDWVVSLLDRVPYTEQEDLSITWTAAPRPTTENYEDRRGILHWSMDMKPGEKQSISLKTKITWPDGMILR